MGKKGNSKDQKKKLTKKEIKQMNHLKLIQGGKNKSSDEVIQNDNVQYKKSA